MTALTQRDAQVDWQVTYLNTLDGKRHVLVDLIDEETADAVIARFGDKRNAFEYLPDCRKERIGGAA